MTDTAVARVQEAFLEAVKPRGIERALESIDGWFIELVGACMKGRICPPARG